MKIISENQFSKNFIEFEDGAKYLRIEVSRFKISWESAQSGHTFLLKEGRWWEWVEAEQSFQLMTKNIPTLEEDYQQHLLAKYPFEKRVREIAEKNVDVGTVMFHLARDFNFVEAVKEYLKKLPR
jgi:hypothetical protein